jgi:glycosyltransferase involved in cell wall biosynthesis
MTRIRLAIVTSHPIQYYAPIFRRLSQLVELDVYYAHLATPADQAKAGFGTSFNWDVDLLSGYRSHFLKNVSTTPGTSHFSGCDTPEIASIIRSKRFDAVLVLGWYLKSFVQAIVAAKVAGIPVLVRGDSQIGLSSGRMRSLAKSLTFPVALRIFDAALYVGERSRDYFRHFSYPANRLFHSPHCVDADWFAARGTAEAAASLRRDAGIADREKVVLFAGKLVPFKRPLDVIDAAAELRSRGQPVTVMIAGAGPLEDAVRQRARERDVRLAMLGFRNQSEMPACYAASGVLVLPSTRRETWGLVANEARACGCPIIVSEDAGCSPDMAADAIVGRAFPLGDVHRFATSIADVLNSPPDKRLVRERAELFSIDAACRGIMQALDWVASRKNTRRTELERSGSIVLPERKQKH